MSDRRRPSAPVPGGAPCHLRLGTAHSRSSRVTSDLGFVGLLLAVGSFIGMLAVGVPALVLEPC